VATPIRRRGAICSPVAGARRGAIGSPMADARHCFAGEHPQAQDSEQRGQQRRRGGHRDEHGDRGRLGHPGEDAEVHHEHPEQRHDHGGAGEDDVPPGGVERLDDRRRHVRAAEDGTRPVAPPNGRSVWRPLVDTPQVVSARR
jgi:hypothetical protein